MLQILKINELKPLGFWWAKPRKSFCCSTMLDKPGKRTFLFKFFRCLILFLAFCCYICVSFFFVELLLFTLLKTIWNVYQINKTLQATTTSFVVWNVCGSKTVLLSPVSKKENIFCSTSCFTKPLVSWRKQKLIFADTWKKKLS